MPAPAPAGARAGDLASVPALERAAPATDAASVLADAAATLQMVPDADEAGFEETAAVTTARHALLFWPVLFPASLGRGPGVLAPCVIASQHQHAASWRPGPARGVS
jgi:hypothetical protein